MFSENGSADGAAGEELTTMPVDIKTVGTAELPPEPAEHDTPEGATLGWSAADFGPVSYASESEQAELTEDVADGTQELSD